MNVLVACEESAIVRDAFRARGHCAWSCDLLPTRGDDAYHYQGDVREVLSFEWDLIIAFPPCTDLSVSGARYWAQKQADGRQQAAIDFALMFWNHPCPKICIENPIGILSTQMAKPTQIIQPWQFGHPESKATCLWLKGLPKLVPTNILDKPARGYWDNQTPSGQNKLSPSPDRAKLRSVTYQGVADAMALQWGKSCD